MSKNMLTTKEAGMLGELLVHEETACKKARLYARTVDNQELKQKFTEIANNHERRFNALLELL
jgi:predicted metal-dependent hydrolase